MSSEVFDGTDPLQLLKGMRTARMAIGRGKVVGIQTDTTYALVADAFKPAAADALRSVRGMAKDAPLGVLLPGIPTLAALAEEVHPLVSQLAKEFWPGALTLIVPARESLAWNLGSSRGTVALRMPADRIALELLSETGPLVASEASVVGGVVAESAVVAEEMFGEKVSVFLSGATNVEPAVVSTVIDATGLDRLDGVLRLVREGGISRADIQEVVGPEHCA